MTERHSHLWNELPKKERERLAPFMIGSQIRYLNQARAKIVRGHERTLADLDSHIKSLEKKLSESLE